MPNDIQIDAWRLVATACIKTRVGYKLRPRCHLRHSGILTAMAVTLLLFTAVLIAAWALARRQRSAPSGPQAPGPRRWPIIGNLPDLNARVPYQALTNLGKIFGPVFSLQLGTVPAVVVSGLDNIKHVLYHKLNHFDARPNFNRYHQLFDGDKENSLAFCDWSDLQRKRREILNDHTFPKVYSTNFAQLSNIINEEVKGLIQDVKTTNTERVQRKSMFTIPESDAVIPKRVRRLLKNKHVSTFVRLPSIGELPEEVTETETLAPAAVDIKNIILKATARIFLRYFCSVETKDNEEFTKFVENFDTIFYEVNQGYASDFLPFLERILPNKRQEMRECSHAIRDFVEKNVIKDRLEALEQSSEDKDYVDALLRNVKFGGDVQLSKDKALFSLEDILGGHTAIGNFLVKLLTFVVDNEDVQKKILDEVQKTGKEYVTLQDRDKMPYTESVIMEALRLISSPIVPHVANQDTTLAGYSVKKGSLIFLNNYDLNMSEELWTEPTKFDPSRFVDAESGARIKPAHFLPFGGGRRSCMGYKLVQLVGFIMVANLVGKFRVCGVSGQDYSQVPIGNLALPKDTFKFAFQSR